MQSHLVEVLARNGGLVTRGEAFDAGLSAGAINTLVRKGELRQVRRGVYAGAALWDSLDEFVGRPRLRVRAAVRLLERGWALSHDSAALEVGMPLLRPQDSLVHITRQGFTSAWTRAGVKHHYARYAPRDLVTTTDGTRHLSLARTAVDIAREHGERAGVVACDWVLRQGVPRSALVEAYVPMAYWPGVTQARSAVDLADPRAESAAESLGRLLVRELGIGDVDCQFPVRLQAGVVWCDLRVGNHVFEVQGRIKYTPTERGGLADRKPEDVVWDEKKRARALRARNLGVSELIWEDYHGSNRAAAIRRLRAEYLVTEQRFGRELRPDLAAEAAAIRERHGWRDRDPA